MKHPLFNQQAGRQFVSSFAGRAGKRPVRRRGAVLVLFVVALIPIVAFMAFAIVVGMLTVAQTQLRDAADAAALAGCRALNGDAANNNNYSAATPSAQAAVTANDVLGSALQTSQLTVNIGRYNYNSATQRFEGGFPGTTGNWNMVQANVTTNLNNSLGFARIFNLTLPNFQATATATHRARDVVFILDFSGSMRFSSLMGTPSSGDRTCNNQDPVVPLFGHYSSSSDGMPAGSASAPYGNANITATTADGRPPIVLDFYTNSSGTQAFSAAPASYATAPGGDVPPKTNKGAGATYAQTVAQVLNIASPTTSTYDNTFESQGYQGYGMTSGTAGFRGYTQGPGYWGKTFYYWPPDPTEDWRTLYFNFPTSKADNSLIWNSSGNLKAPVVSGSGGYRIDYAAILNFIKNVGPSVFPSRLQSGRILYYDSIPNTIDTTVWPPTDMNQRFWKDYIDYVIGVMQVNSSTYVVISNGTEGNAGYGVDFTWGTVRITALSSLTGGSKTPYMHYADNPKRPKTGFWFGPMTMVDFLGNYNLWYSGYGNDASRFCWWPGTCHESPMYACKLGIQAAISDAKNNHPNDYYSVIMFSTPLTSTGDTNAARFNRVRVALGQNFTNLSDSLWYPPSTYGNSAATVRPYDANNLEVPRAMGGTCYSMGLMLAYNQLSGNASSQTFNPAQPVGDAGGNGRKGAQKIVVFETDGCPNTGATATFVNNGAYQSYYRVRYNSGTPSLSEFPSGVTGYSDSSPTLMTQIIGIINQLAALDTAGGFNSATRPFLLHCIAFGPQINSTAINTLNQMQTAGNVTDNMPTYKIINGNASTYSSNLQTAISKILQDGVQVSLIQ